MTISTAQLVYFLFLPVWGSAEANALFWLHRGRSRAHPLAERNQPDCKRRRLKRAP